MSNLDSLIECVPLDRDTHVRRLKPLPEPAEYEGKYKTEILECSPCEQRFVWLDTYRLCNDATRDRISRILHRALAKRGVAWGGETTREHNCEKGAAALNG